MKILAILSMFLLSACSSIPTLDDVAQLSPWYKRNEVKQVSVYVTPDEGLRHAVNIDVVFVYKYTLLTMVSGMNALDWFEQKSAIKAGYGKSIDILEWQMVAGFADQKLELPERHADAYAVIAFAYYPENPDAKVVLTEIETPWVVFTSGKLTTAETAPVNYSEGS